MPILKLLTEQVGIHIGNPSASAFVLFGSQRQAVAIRRAIHYDASRIRTTLSLTIDRGYVDPVLEIKLAHTVEANQRANTVQKTN